jgi:hypothetical protein
VSRNARIVSKDVSRLAIGVSSGSTILATAFFNLAQPIIRTHIERRGDIDIKNTMDEVEFMRYALRYIALCEEEAVTVVAEQVQRNNSKAAKKAAKKAGKK